MKKGDKGMTDLRKTTDLVYNILIHDAAARNSDNELYCKVLEHYGKRMGVDFDRVSVINFFRLARRNKIPSIETVGRCRRKLQEEYADLRADEDVERKRMTRENDFRKYAREL